MDGAQAPGSSPGDRHSCLSVQKTAQVKGQTGMSVPRSWLRGLVCNANEKRSGTVLRDDAIPHSSPHECDRDRVSAGSAPEGSEG